MILGTKTRECPSWSSGFKLAIGSVAIGLIVAAAESPIDWRPGTLHEVVAVYATDASAAHASPAGTQQPDPAAHVEAF